ncbi:hypothetical protein L4D06_17820 [Enterovibrio makurazakiensis]|uniref:ABM domain-containing protein n=1 Tax=Enterovibrio gelatinilyticus TaxID=2899819 RepID=A0ABT5R5X2_9GAMM|nr:hypothetical protein [Enterovibrio sp. ZSDZ42]MDD1795684.1 hypothetical protein [Enterovibrio sp. ZSDZ42]
MENVVETVRFKLVEGTDIQAFVVAAEKTESFIRDFEGFQYRSLSYNADSQLWTDIVYWASMENAVAASEQFMSFEAAQQLVAFIDPTSLVMAHDYVKMSVCSSTM